MQAYGTCFFLFLYRVTRQRHQRLALHVKYHVSCRGAFFPQVIYVGDRGSLFQGLCLGIVIKFARIANKSAIE